MWHNALHQNSVSYYWVPQQHPPLQYCFPLPRLGPPGDFRLTSVPNGSDKPAHRRLVAWHCPGLLSLCLREEGGVSRFSRLHSSQTDPIPSAPSSRSPARSPACDRHFRCLSKSLPNSSSSGAEYFLTTLVSCAGPFLMLPSACWVAGPSPCFFLLKVRPVGHVTHTVFRKLSSSFSDSSHGLQVLGPQEGLLSMDLTRPPSSSGPQLFSEASQRPH